MGSRFRGRLPAALLALVALLLAPAAAGAQGRDAPPPDLNAAAWTLIDARTGETLTAREANVRRPIASTTKLMTAYLALERLGMHRQVARGAVLPDPRRVAARPHPR